MDQRVLAIELVTSDDPPLYLEYPRQKEAPVMGKAEPTHPLVHVWHSIGVGLQSQGRGDGPVQSSAAFDEIPHHDQFPYRQTEDCESQVKHE